MKTAIVPAQVTTVEDKIAGNLSFTQVLLMTAPVFLSGAVFAFLPPFMSLSGYKLVVCIIIATAFISLAIRIKGKIVLVWMGVIGRYRLRPRLYLYDKNDLYLRLVLIERKKRVSKSVKQTTTAKPREPITIPTQTLARIENIVNDPRAKLEFKATRKGGLRVHIQEIK